MPSVIEREGPGHQDMVVTLAPVDDEIAAGQRHAHLAPGEPTPHRGDGGSAGRGAASLGEPRATLPGAEPQGVWPGHLRERDVGALGKQRMMLEHRPEAGEVMRLDIVDEEDAMRVADIDHRRRAQARIVDRRLQLDRPRVVERLG